MTTRLPKFVDGMAWGEVDPAAMRNLVEAVRISLEARGYPGGRVTTNAAGQLFGLTTSPIPPARPSAIRVAIIETTDTAALKALTVREVIHANTPPITGALAWRGAAFRAYPEPGAKVAEFEGLIFTGPLPDETTAIVNAYSRDGSYLVAGSGGGVGIRPVIVRTQLPYGAGTVLQVTPVLIENGTYRADDEHTDFALAWPGLRARHYAQMAQPFGPVNPATNILPAVQLGGLWYVMQIPRWAFTPADQRWSFTDCVTPRISAPEPPDDGEPYRPGTPPLGESAGGLNQPIAWPVLPGGELRPAIDEAEDAARRMPGSVPLKGRPGLEQPDYPAGELGPDQADDTPGPDITGRTPDDYPAGELHRPKPHREIPATPARRLPGEVPTKAGEPAGLAFPPGELRPPVDDGPIAEAFPAAEAPRTAGGELQTPELPTGQLRPGGDESPGVGFERGPAPASGGGTTPTTTPPPVEPGNVQPAPGVTRRVK